MTPDEFRALADEATPGLADKQTRFRAEHQLLELAPDLARLCAELGEALAQITALADNATEHYNDLGMADVARAALARLSELKL